MVLHARIVTSIACLIHVLLVLLPTGAVDAQESLAAENCPVLNVPKKTRPDVGGPPVEVSVGVFLLDILAIRESEENFDADLILRLRWHDPRLSSNALGFSLEDCNLTLKDIWHPQIDIINLGNVGPKQWRRLEIGADGTVLFDRRVTGTLTTPLELKEFPRDSQELVLRLSSLVYGAEDVALAVDAVTSRSPNAAYAGWEIVSNLSTVMPALEIASGTSHVRIFHTVLVKRLFGYWFWRLVAPLSLIVLMAWCIFWLDPQSHRSQIAVGASAIFTLIAFQLSLGDTLPRISYLTNADKLILTATVLVFFALGQAVVTSRLAVRNEFDRARRYDIYGRWVYPVSYLVGAVIALY